MDDYDAVIDIGVTDIDVNSEVYSYNKNNKYTTIGVVRYRIEISPGFMAYCHYRAGSGSIFRLGKILNNGIDTNIPTPIDDVYNVSVYYRVFTRIPLMVAIVPSRVKSLEGKFLYYINDGNQWIEYKDNNGHELYNELPELLKTLYDNLKKFDPNKGHNKMPIRGEVLNQASIKVDEPKAPIENIQDNSYDYILLSIIFGMLTALVIIVLFIRYIYNRVT